MVAAIKSAFVARIQRPRNKCFGVRSSNKQWVKSLVLQRVQEAMHSSTSPGNSVRSCQYCTIVLGGPCLYRSQIGTLISECWTSSLMNSERCRWCSALSVISANSPWLIDYDFLPSARIALVYPKLYRRERAGRLVKDKPATLTEDLQNGACSGMNILSYNPGHDGAIAYLKSEHLLVSIEAEKNSNWRYSPISSRDVFDVLGELDEIPDVICTGGWWPRDHYDYLHGSHVRYRGVSKTDVIIDRRRLFGKASPLFLVFS